MRTTIVGAWVLLGVRVSQHCCCNSIKASFPISWCHCFIVALPVLLELVLGHPCQHWYHDIIIGWLKQNKKHAPHILHVYNIIQGHT